MIVFNQFNDNDFDAFIDDISDFEKECELMQIEDNNNLSSDENQVSMTSENGKLYSPMLV